MTRSLAFVWKESRRHVEGLSIRTLEGFNRTICLSEGLPDLPRDLSEPQYADLYFSRHCHVSPNLISRVLLTFIFRNVLRALFRPFFGAHESTFAEAEWEARSLSVPGL
jgi:hypothetical protein